MTTAPSSPVPAVEADFTAGLRSAAKLLRDIAEAKEYGARGDLGSMFSNQSASDLRSAADRVEKIPAPAPKATPTPGRAPEADTMAEEVEKARSILRLYGAANRAYADERYRRAERGTMEVEAWAEKQCDRLEAQIVQTIRAIVAELATLRTERDAAMHDLNSKDADIVRLALETRTLKARAEKAEAGTGEDRGEASLTQAASDVLAERRRQVAVEGWTPEHDDEHESGELALAAASYAAGGGLFRVSHLQVPMQVWPYRWEFKPTTPRRNLVKAGALIQAEIERLDRAEARDALATERRILAAPPEPRSDVAEQGERK